MRCWTCRFALWNGTFCRPKRGFLQTLCCCFPTRWQSAGWLTAGFVLHSAAIFWFRFDFIGRHLLSWFRRLLSVYRHGWLVTLWIGVRNRANRHSTKIAIRFLHLRIHIAVQINFCPRLMRSSLRPYTTAGSLPRWCGRRVWKGILFLMLTLCGIMAISGHAGWDNSAFFECKKPSLLQRRLIEYGCTACGLQHVVGLITIDNYRSCGCALVAFWGFLYTLVQLSAPCGCFVSTRPAALLPGARGNLNRSCS